MDPVDFVLSVLSHVSSENDEGNKIRINNKNYKIMRKFKKLSLTLALLITAATGAWAQTLADDPEVNLNDTKTEASFEMPTYDMDVNYELVRDMAVSMTTKIGDGNDGYRIRLQKNEQTGKYEPAEMTVQQMKELVKVHDAIENYDLTFGVQDANCIVNIYAANENNESTGEPIAFEDLTPGRYIAKAVAATGSAYEGETGMSNIFELYEGYQVVITAGEYVTYYKDEAVRLDEKDKNDIELCTITAVEDGKEHYQRGEDHPAHPMQRA